MTTHPILLESIRQAVKAAGQPEAVARRLEAWLNALSSGSEAPDADNASTRSRIEEVLNAILPPPANS